MVTNEKPIIVMVGSSNTDLIAYSPRIPAPAETIHGSRFETGFGGKGANQAVMAGKLGADVTVITKLGRSGKPGWPENFTEQAMRAHTEASLRRLEVEALDLTQLHCVPMEQLRRGDVFNTVLKLKREGKIRHFGASVESMDEAQLCLRVPELASLQIIFNLFRQKPIDTLFADAARADVALIVRLPLASGLLGGH